MITLDANRCCAGFLVIIGNSGYYETINERAKIMNYLKTKSYAIAKGETNDCAVKAISIACDVPYHVAHKAAAVYGRIARKGTYMSTTQATVSALGFSMVAVDSTARTVKSLDRDPAVQKGHYMALVSRHILAVIDGKVEDWSEDTARRIKQVYKITPKVSRSERKALKAAIMAK